MKGFYLLLHILLFIFISACQVEEKSSSGGMVSGHLPSSNKFTVLTPTAGNYVANDIITFKLKFPYKVTISGTPQLSFGMGANSAGSGNRLADYARGSDSTTIEFDYVVQAADNDSDGIKIYSLTLPGGATCTFEIAPDIHNCNTSFSAQVFTNVIVDNQAPTITAIAVTNPAGFYHADDTLTFRVTFSEKVFTTGSPTFRFTLNEPASVLEADLVSGSGTNILTFSKVITDNMYEPGGISYSTTPINLTSGTIQDAAGITSTFTVAASNTLANTVYIDGTLPYVVKTTLPAAGTYAVNQTLEFVVEFDKDITVNGVPYIELEFATGANRYALLTSNSGRFATFQYPTYPGDSDPNGIRVQNRFTFPAGAYFRGTSTRDFQTPTANNNLKLHTNPATLFQTAIIINAVQPQVISSARSNDTTNPVWPAGAPVDNKWIIGQNLDVALGFNAPMLVNQQNGVPRVALDFNGQTRYASYISGGDGQTSLTFRYTIVEGDLSATNVRITALELNGGVITDTNNTNTLLSIPAGAVTLNNTLVDGVRPTISTITVPNGIYSGVTTPTDRRLIIVLNWNESVSYGTPASPTIPITIDTPSVTRTSTNYLSGNETQTVRHIFIPTAGDIDLNGINVGNQLNLNGSLIKDQAGNDATNLALPVPALGHYPSVILDAQAPVIQSVDIMDPPPKLYKVGDIIRVKLTYDENVTVTAPNPTIRVSVRNGAATYRTAAYDSVNSTATELIFTYTVVNGDYNTTGLQASNISAVARITDQGGNATPQMVTTTFAGSTVDGLSPVATASTSDSGTFTSGEELTISLTFNEDITVNTAGGTPQLTVTNTEGSNLLFDYDSFDGTRVITFKHTIQPNNLNFRGLSNLTSFSLNNAVIRDINDNNASLTFTALSLSNIQLVPTSLRIWANHATPSNKISSGPTVSFGGSGTTNCGAKNCRVFSGTESISFSPSLPATRVAYLVFKTPDFSVTNFPFISGHSDLVESSGNFDYVSASTTASINTFNDQTRYVLKVSYNSPENLSELIETGFVGGIGEIMIFNGVPTGPQETTILNYLNSY